MPTSSEPAVKRSDALRGEWRVATDERYCGPHFRMDRDDGTAWLLYLDVAEWVLRCEMPDALPLQRTVRLSDVLAVVPDFRAEAVGMTRAVLGATEAALRTALLDALAALDAGDYYRANGLLDDLGAWRCERLDEDLRSVGDA